MILSIETSTEVCSVAIHQDGKLIASSQSSEAYSHAEKLAPMIDDILRSNNIERKYLKSIAVSAGPGSYTGLRIGVSTAKGLCFALDIPLITVGTLESMLESVEPKEDHSLLCPMLDARRMEVYCLVGKSNGEVLEPKHPKIIYESSFEDHLKNHVVYFYGNGAEKCNTVITHQNVRFIDGITPSAINIGKLASVKYENREFDDLAYFEPEYLKAFHAIKAKNPLQ
ncbi:MAG: tRNA (adenosine(37)-N6)-threonylcarbamoyltransferase complex dimerization subunit type 1 TsaB [Bacteroidota bacterium]